MATRRELCSSNKSPAPWRPRRTTAPDRRSRLLAGTALAGVARGLALAALLALAGAPPALANPTGGKVVGGRASISAPAAGTLQIDQSSHSAIINWQGFSIAPGESTVFQQPSRRSVTLNRVVGDDLSNIEGSLRANGNLFLVNPNGVVFGAGARVDVGGLVATTAGISDQDFLAGLYNFASPSDNPDAMVVNHGSITLADQGLAALVAPGVENSGIIAASLGSVTLAGAETFSLDMTGDGLLAFGVAGSVSQAPAGADALVSNSGSIAAPGGQVLLTAAAASAVIDNVINMSGTVEARSASVDEAGRIVLGGGDSGLVEVSGVLDASGVEAGQSGGRIEVLGDLVALRDGAALDVSGAAGGGTALVGGAFQGGGPQPNTRRTLVEQGAGIEASATEAGKGGTVVVWADEQAALDGTITARGGPEGGDGGFVETSGKEGLHVSGRVDVGAPAGEGGKWLLDPQNISVVSGAGVVPPVAFDDPPEIGTLAVDADAINAAVADSTVVLQAENDIDVDAAIDTDANLVLQAGNNILLNVNILTNGRDLHLEANSPEASAPSGVGIIETNGDPDNFDGTSIDTGGGDLVMLAEDFIFRNFADSFSVGDGDITIAMSTPGSVLTLGGTTSVINNIEIGQFALNGVFTFGEAVTAGSDGLGSGALTIRNDVVTVEGDLVRTATPAFEDASLVQILAGSLADIDGDIDTNALLINSDDTIDYSADLDVIDDSSLEAGGTITIVGDFVSNGADLFIEADSPVP